MRGSKVSEYLYEPDSFVPLAKLESEAKQAPAQEVLGQVAMENVANESAEAKSFAVYYYQCDQVGAPQELTDEAGRIVWAASYKVWGQAQALQMLRTSTDGEAAVFTANERPLALAASGEVQSLNLVEQPGGSTWMRNGAALQPLPVLRSGDGVVPSSRSDWY